jgi:tRNA pseudouridine38-40 synthase
MSMRTIKLILEYDGTNYHGWQRQTNGLSIQQVLEEKIAVMTGEPVKVIGSGRTDAGVHALNQTAHFKTGSRIAEAWFLKGLNSLLPTDIVVKELEEVADTFHARYDVKSKIYLYQIFNGAVRPVLQRRQAWFVPGRLNLEAMCNGAVLSAGTHDFSSFCSTHSDAPDHVRTVHYVHVRPEPDGMIKIEVEADGFLRYMVRSMVGTLVDIGRGKYAWTDIPAMLEARDRRCAGMTAPARGLFLKEVKY